MGDKADSLTGLPYRTAFEGLLADLLDNGAGRQVSLALIDLDGFLGVNETHGHEAGDTVLRSIAEAASRHLPVEDGAQLFRIGGDEFAAVMPGVEKEQAFLALERVRAAVDELAAPAPTVSIGIASAPDDAGTRQELARKADDALYRAKLTGRNKVSLAREEKKVPKTSHYTQGQLDRLSALSDKEGVGEAELLREALDDLLQKYSS